MNQFPAYLNVKTFNESKQKIHNEFLLSYCRKLVFEKIMINDLEMDEDKKQNDKNHNNNDITIDFSQLQIGEKTIYNLDKIDKNIMETLMKELKDLGWFTSLYYGNTWLVISRDPNSLLRNIPSSLSFD